MYWEDEFERHPIHQSIEQLLLLEPACRRRVEEVEDEGVSSAHLDRIFTISEFVQSSLKSVVALLVDFKLLTQIHQNFETAHSQLSNFKETGNIREIETASNNLVATIKLVTQLADTRSEESVEGLSNAITSFRRSTGQLLGNIRREGKKVQSELKDFVRQIERLEKDSESIKHSIQQQKARLDQAIGEFQSQFSESEDRRRSRFDSVQSEMQEKVLEAIKQQQDRLVTAREEVTKQFAALNLELEKSVQDIVDSSGKEANELLNDLEAKLKKADEIVGAITERGLIGGYQQSASSSGRAKLFWQLIATISLLGLVVYATIFVGDAAKGDDAPKLLAKILISFSFLGLAGYAAKLAEKYRVREERHRKAEFELAAITPYLQSLPIEQQHELKAELAKEFFGKPLDTPLTSGQPEKSELRLVNGELKEFMRWLASKFSAGG